MQIKDSIRFKLTIAYDGSGYAGWQVQKKDVGVQQRVEEALREVFEYAVELGGTITGEHGVGLAKKPFLPGALGPVGMEVLKQLKKSFDPHNILNPGKIFD